MPVLIIQNLSQTLNRIADVFCSILLLLYFHIDILCLPGIEAHRDSDKLMNAVDHIDSMSSRLDDSGFPQEYSYEELHHIVVEENKYPFEDFERVVGKCLESSGECHLHGWSYLIKMISFMLHFIIGMCTFIIVLVGIWNSFWIQSNNNLSECCLQIRVISLHEKYMTH